MQESEHHNVVWIGMIAVLEIHSVSDNIQKYFRHKMEADHQHFTVLKNNMYLMRIISLEYLSFHISLAFEKLLAKLLLENVRAIPNPHFQFPIGT